MHVCHVKGPHATVLQASWHCVLGVSWISGFLANSAGFDDSGKFEFQEGEDMSSTVAVA